MLISVSVFGDKEVVGTSDQRDSETSAAEDELEQDVGWPASNYWNLSCVALKQGHTQKRDSHTNKQIHKYTRSPPLTHEGTQAYSQALP